MLLKELKLHGTPNEYLMYSRLWVFMGKLWVIYLGIQNGSLFRGVFVFL